MIYNVSIDGGNSSIKVVVEGLTEHEMMYSNVVANASKVDYDLIRNIPIGKNITGKNMLDVSVITHSNQGNNTEDRFLFAGMAEKYRDSLKNRSNTLKCNDKQLIKSMLTATAFSIVRFKIENGQKINKRMTIRTNIGTGLPYQEWRNTKNREIFKNNLEGNHIIKFNHPFFDELEIELIVEFALIGIEGESTIELITSDEKSEYQKKDALEQLENVIVGIDMGAFTTEIIGRQFVLVEDEETGDEDAELQTMSNLSKGVPDGIGFVMENTILAIEKNEIVDPLIRRDIEKAFTSKAGKRNGSAGYLVGSNINIIQYFEPHAKKYAQIVAEEFYGLYNTTQVKNKIRKIYIMGGGSMSDIIVDEFKMIIEGQGYDLKNVITLRDPSPIYSNCYGYYTQLLKELAKNEEEEDIA